jgi:hypothetical protein
LTKSPTTAPRVEWNGIDNVDAAIAKRTGQVLAIEAPAPGVGWP